MRRVYLYLAMVLCTFTFVSCVIDDAESRDPERVAQTIWSEAHADLRYINKMLTDVVHFDHMLQIEDDSQRDKYFDTVQRVLHDDEIDRIATVLVEMQTKDDPTVPALLAQLAECEKGITNMLNAIQMGILTSSTKERLEALEKERATLKANIAHAQMQRPVYTKDQIVRWMSRFKGGDISEPTYRKQIIDIFLNSIYVYDDKLVFTGGLLLIPGSTGMTP